MMFDSLFRLWRRERLVRSGQARPTILPKVEALEVRWVPSTVTDNLTPSALLPGAVTPPAAVAPPATPATAVSTAVNPALTIPVALDGTPASVPMTTGTVVNAAPSVIPPAAPAPVNVSTPVPTTPAPVNPTNTGTPVPSPVLTTPSDPSTLSQGQGQSPSTPPSSPSTSTGGTSTNSSPPLLTIPEYYGGTTLNSTTLPPMITPPPAPSSPSATTGAGLIIGGTVYEDTNNSGLLESGEPGISNNQILLKDGSGNVIATTTTDGNGQYQFTTNQTVNTSPQNQTQQVAFGMAPTNYTQTQTVQQFNPALGTLNSVQIIEQGQLTSDIKVENLDNSPGQVTGTVSGQLSLSAPGVSNLTLNPTGTETNTLGAYDGHIDFAGTSGYDFGAQTAQQTQMATLSASNTDLSAWIGTGQVNLTQNAQATSSANGPGNVLSQISSAAGANVKVVYNYTPTNALQPGTYTVVQPQVPPGFTNGQDTGDNHTPFPANGPPNTIPVTLTNGSSPNNNFGELKPSTLSGITYLDNQHDGKFDPGDPIMPGVTIQLSNSQGPIGTPQVTGPDGSYSFANLPPGTYTLTALPPPGFVSTGANPGNLGSTAPPSASSITVVVPENSQGTDYDFGLGQAPTTPQSPPGTPIGVPVTPPPPPSTPLAPPPDAIAPQVAPSVPFGKQILVGNNWASLFA